MRYTLNYRGTEIARFVGKIVRRVVVPSLGACWEWTGCRKATGYGQFKPAGDKHTKVVRAHRWAWERVNGPVPSGLELDHLCRNPACVRPSHMQAVTHVENMHRGKRAAQTHCKHGHPLFGDNVRHTKRGRVCRTCERNKHAPGE